jgi:uncharacterized protein YabE (DUF348 family)/3D (Asp-Asp-Asp) domain-containing protein
MSKLIKRKKVMLALLALILLTATVGIGVYDFGVKAGSIDIDGNREEIKTNLDTVGELLEEREIEVIEEDKLSPGVDEKLEEGFEIKIEKAIPVLVTVDGETAEIMTAETTVEKVLQSNGYYYDESDRISPSLDSEVAEEMEIVINRVTKAYKSDEEEIAFETVTRENNELEKGTSRTVQAGEVGTIVIETKETYVDGELESIETVKETIEKNPVAEIIEKGTKEIVVEKEVVSNRASNTKREEAPKEEQEVKHEAPAVKESSATVESKPAAAPAPAPAAKPAPAPAPAAETSGKPSGNGIVMNASAYDDSLANYPGYTGLTASGTRVRPGVIAVDPRVIPLGTRVYIEHMDGTPWGYAIAEDTGGAIKGNKIDIYMKSGALQFGRRNMRLFIVN